MTLKQTALRHRNLVQLITLLSLFAVYPIAGDRAAGRILLDMMFTAVLLAAVASLSVRPRWYRPAVGLAVMALVLMWATRYVGPDSAALSIGLLGLFFGYVLIVSFVDLLRGRTVSGEMVFQALNIYLFLGMFFAAVFALIEISNPGSLNVPAHELPDLRRFDQRDDWFSLTFYFSFVNLTTVGFGDMTPATEVTRSLSIVEAVVGQFYLAVLVARLVGLHIAQGTAEPPQ